jgi:hypothetical protein
MTGLGDQGTRQALVRQVPSQHSVNRVCNGVVKWHGGSPSMKLDEIESRASDQKKEQQRERGKHEQGSHKGQETPAGSAEEVCGEADDEQSSGDFGHEISPR